MCLGGVPVLWRRTHARGIIPPFLLSVLCVAGPAYRGACLATAKRWELTSVPAAQSPMRARTIPTFGLLLSSSSWPRPDVTSSISAAVGGRACGRAPRAGGRRERCGEKGCACRCNRGANEGQRTQRTSAPMLACAWPGCAREREGERERGSASESARARRAVGERRHTGARGRRRAGERARNDTGCDHEHHGE